MNLVSIIIIAAIGFCAVIGIVIGSIKGFTRVKSWAVELLLSGVLGIVISKLISGKMSAGYAPAIITLGVTLVLICLFMLLFAIFRSLLKKRIEKRKELSYYEHYDAMEENTEQILNAIGTEDKKKYKRLTKHKFKQSGGAWSGIDRLFGALTLGIKGAVLAGLLAAAALVVLDFTRFASEGGALHQTLSGIYSSGVWGFFKNYIFDFIIIGIVMICIKCGYSGGISSSLWTLMVFGMVVGAAVLSFYLSFKVDDFVSAAQVLEGKLSGKLPDWSESVLSAFNITTLKLSEIIIGIGLFVLMLVAVILIAVFVPRLIDRAREGAIFQCIDGVFGAIVLTVIIIGILYLVGSVVNSLYELSFMNVFNAYFEKSAIATYFYNKNLLDLHIPLKDWLS